MPPERGRGDDVDRSERLARLHGERAAKAFGPGRILEHEHLLQEHRRVQPGRQDEMAGRAARPRRETRQAPDPRLGSSSSCPLLAGRRSPRQDDAALGRADPRGADRCRQPQPNPSKPRPLGAEPDATAPDGTAVRLLLSLRGGSMAHFELPAGAVSHAVTHRTVEEIWFVTSGRGSIWRRQDGLERIEALEPWRVAHHPARNGVSVSRRGRTRRSPSSRSPCPLGPGMDEALPVAGPWAPTVAAGPA